MRVSTLVTGIVAPLLIGQTNAAYVLDTVMWGSTFFSNFNFATVDPNNGYVQYLTQSAAQTAGLIFQAESNPARISADSTTTLLGTAGSPGRKSVRIESKKRWTHGLYVFNVAAMPAPVCGVWPALWMTGANWPNNGEIDILEGISLQTKALYSMHTSNGCTFSKQTQLGTVVGGNCYGGATNNQGCGTTASSTNSYGAGLNSAGGGAYVVEWTSAFIKIWWYPKGSVPADISNAKPDQTKRGTPQAYWLGSSTCNIDSKFKLNQIVVNINFCGDWAGNAWAGDATCKKKATTCAAYVAKNPKDFAAAKWQFNSIRVYQQSTSKRDVGIEDPALEWERSLYLNDTLTAERDIAEVEQVVGGAHLHRHRHRSDRHF